MEKAGADINFDLGELSLVGINKAPYVCDNISMKHAALTVFPSDTAEKVKPPRRVRRSRKLVGPGWTAVPQTRPHDIVGRGWSRRPKR